MFNLLTDMCVNKISRFSEPLLAIFFSVLSKLTSGILMSMPYYVYCTTHVLTALNVTLYVTSHKFVLRTFLCTLHYDW